MRVEKARFTKRRIAGRERKFWVRLQHRVPVLRPRLGGHAAEVARPRRGGSGRWTAWRPRPPPAPPGVSPASRRAISTCSGSVSWNSSMISTGKRAAEVVAQVGAVAQRVARQHQQVHEVEDAAVALDRLVAVHHRAQGGHHARVQGRRERAPSSARPPRCVQAATSRASCSVSGEGQCPSGRCSSRMTGQRGQPPRQGHALQRPDVVGEGGERGEASGPACPRRRRGPPASRPRPPSPGARRARPRRRWSRPPPAAQVALVDERAREAAQRAALAVRALGLRGGSGARARPSPRRGRREARR